MIKLLIATHNKAKLGELLIGVEKLRQENIAILSLNDLSISKDPEETGKTFRDNSVLKAKYYGDLTGIPTIADDGGLLIDILNGEPGVKSKRWLGYDASDEELISYTLRRLEGLPVEKRTAKLETTLCFYIPQTHEIFCESEQIHGYIAQKQSGRPTDGYPYRSLFVVKRYGKYYDELTQIQHEDINHRLIALGRLVEKIKVHLLK